MHTDVNIKSLQGIIDWIYPSDHVSALFIGKNYVLVCGDIRVLQTMVWIGVDI